VKKDTVPLGKAIAIILAVVILAPLTVVAGVLIGIYFVDERPNNNAQAVSRVNPLYEPTENANTSTSQPTYAANPTSPEEAIVPDDQPSGGIYLVNTTYVQGRDFFISNDHGAYLIRQVGIRGRETIRIMDNARSIAVSSVDGGGVAFFVLTLNNDLYAWGNNRTGLVGDDTGLDRTMYEPFRVMTDVASVRGGHNSARAIRLDGTLWQWGGGTFAPRYVRTVHDMMEYYLAIPAAAYGPAIPLVNGNHEIHPMIESSSILTDEIINALGGRDNIVSIVRGQIQHGFVAIEVSRFYALTADGVLWGWGENGGRLGDGTRANRALPVQIAENVRRITPTHFITNNNDWYFYSTMGTYRGRYELYRPLLAFRDVAYVQAINMIAVANGEFRIATWYGTWFTPDGQLVRARREDGYNIYVLIDNIMLPSMVRADTDM